VTRKTGKVGKKTKKQRDEGEVTRRTGKHKTGKTRKKARGK